MNFIQWLLIPITATAALNPVPVTPNPQNTPVLEAYMAYETPEIPIIDGALYSLNISIEDTSTSTRLENIFGTSTTLMMKIMSCEGINQFNPDGSIVRGSVNKDDIGAWQINTYYHGKEAKDMGIDIYTFLGNAQFAEYLYSKHGTSDWNASRPCWLSPL